MDYIAAAQLYRVSPPLKLFTKYLFMNAVDPIIAYAMLDFGNVILTASVLNFIGGVGIQPGTPILGTMASDGVSYGFPPRYWWWAIYPSLAVLVIALGFVLLGGDRLQDIIGGRAAY